MKFVLSLFAVCFLFLAIGAGVVSYGYTVYSAAGPLKQPVHVTVPKGTGVSSITSLLEENGVIDNPLLFKVATRLTDKHASLKAGEYEFLPRASMSEVLSKLEQGDIILRQVTIPEGLTSFEIMRLLKNDKGLKQDYEGVPEEGSLLPNTYAYQKGDGTAFIIEQMQDAMKTTLDKAWDARVNDLPFDSKEEAIIMASIIEKETGVSGERGDVAGVFTNRLRKGMPLQTDPTVIYAITGGKHKNDGKGPLGRRLLRKDMSIDSAYNTYKYPGLPKGPICNPGKASIEAALNPASNDYIYFVADGSGGHIFAKTLAEHNKNVAQWRKIRRSQ